MAHIFLDESGDLGFNFRKTKTSKYFVISFLFTKDKNRLERIVKKVYKSFTRKELKHHSGTLHAYKETRKTRIKTLQLLTKEDIAIVVIYLNKRKVYTKLQDEKHVLYNYVANILLDRVYTKKLIPLNTPIYLIASRRETNKFLNDNFKNYLENQLHRHHKIKITVEIKSPSQEKALQIVDMVSWAMFRKIEHEDESYALPLKGKIIEESPLFP
jgi:hypothetical protein